MRILVKVDAYHNGEPTKAGTVIDVDDVDAVRWIKEQIGIEWRPTRIYPSKGLGKILGVSPLDLKLPKEWYVTVQHLHVGNSKKRRRKGSEFATWAIVRLCSDHRVIGEYTAIPRKGDRPNRATGVQVAIGRAIVLAFSDSTSWTARELLSNRTTWRRFSGEAKAFMQSHTMSFEPGNENTRPVFSKQKAGDHKDRGGLREFFAEGPLARAHAHAHPLDEDDKGVDTQFRKLAFRKLATAGNGDDDIQSAVNRQKGLRWDDGRRQVAWSKLSSVQVRQAKELLLADLKHIPTLRECATQEYIIKSRKVIGVVYDVPVPESMR